MTVFSKLHNAFRAQIGTEGLDGETELDVRCISCARKVRVCSWNQVKKGDHIVMKGEKCIMNIGGKQISPYTHHAIVKSVVITDSNNSSAMVTLIHFYSTPFDLTLRIQETTNLMDLLYYEIYVLQYRHQTHPADKIVERAETIVASNATVEYYILMCNCEHFCNWCCVGQEASFQADNFGSVVDAIYAEVGSFLGRLLRVILKFVFVSLEDLSKVAAGAVAVAPWGLLAINTLLYLIYTIWKHHKLEENKKHGVCCSACCLRKKQELWMTFLTYCTLQVGGLGLVCYLLTVVASKGVVIGVLLLCSTLSLGFMKSVPRIRKFFGSPFQGRLHRVTSMSNIWIGDVISFDHWKISHDAVVSSVSITPNGRKKKGQIRVIYYSLPSLFGQRKIVEEAIEIDLTRDFIKGHDYSGYEVHPPEVVVERARKRLGETKFGLLSNRSCHFCHWTKVVEEDYTCNVDECDAADKTELLYQRDMSMGETMSCLKSLHVNHYQGRVCATKLLQKTWARIRDDVRQGEIISFKYRGLWHKAICTDVEFNKESLSKLSLSVVHYGKNCMVSEDIIEFDLKTQDVWIYKYHPIYNYGTKEIIRRARSRIGERNYNMLLHRSTHFAQEIALKEVDGTISDLDEIQKGDVIMMMYWGLKHAAVVTEVERRDSKPDTSGRIRMVHYALDSLFSTRFVKEEYIGVDLNKDLVWKKNYAGYSSYPQKVVVKRVRSRVGERRFSVFGNTSWDLAHWAKVLQRPAVIRKRCRSGQTGDSEDYVLVPKLGSVFEGFQRLQAASWMDLQTGSIVDYKYYLIWHQGILTEIDEKKKTICVIHYGTSKLFATRTIMESVIKLDLAYDNIWLYVADPRRCHSASDILANARKRLGEQRWERGNCSWDFCKDCVLKKTSQER